MIKQSNLHLLCCYFLILLINGTLSHPNCVEPIDGSIFPPKLTEPLEFCVEYSDDIDGSCCTKETEINIAANVVNSLIDRTNPCFEYARQLYCAYCSPYAGHYFESEGNPEPRQSTWMCPLFCRQFWRTCAQAEFNTSGPIALGEYIRIPGLENTNGLVTLQSLYQDENEYCELFSTSNPVSCYSNDLEDKKVNFGGPGVPYKAMRAFPQLNLMNVPHDPPVSLHITQMTGFNDGSNRICVVFQHGVIVAFDNRADVTNYDVILDIRNDVYYDGGGGSEYGLLGVEFHPNFKKNGWIFIKYSHLNNQDILTRYTFNHGTNAIDPNSKLVILAFEYTGVMHHGGPPQFGNDGYLYYPSGDGVNFDVNFVEYNPASDPQSLLGKILRIDVSSSTPEEPYKIPPDNPFVGDNGWRPEIYAYGFRNPWKFSYDSVKDRFWLGDVGQFSFEEINVVERGKFHGWHKREGYNCYYPRMSTYGNPNLNCVTPDEVLPIIEFPHSLAPEFCEIQSDPPHCRWNIQGNAVIGGWVYRGKKNPSLQGVYLFSNFEPASAAKLYMVQHNEDNPRQIRNIFRIELVNDQIFDFRIPTLGTDADGEIYIINYDNPNDIWTLEPDSTQPPISLPPKPRPTPTSPIHPSPHTGPPKSSPSPISNNGTTPINPTPISTPDFATPSSSNKKTFAFILMGILILGF